MTSRIECTNDRRTRSSQSRTLQARSLAAQHRRRRHRRRGRAAARDGVRDRLGRQAGTGLYTAIVAGIAGVAVRRQPHPDRRPDRAPSSSSWPAITARARHRRVADRHAAWRASCCCCSGVARLGGDHAVHSGSGDRRLHRRHRRDHLGRAVAATSSACPRSAGEHFHEKLWQLLAGRCPSCIWPTTALALLACALADLSSRACPGLQRVPGPLIALRRRHADAGVFAARRRRDDRQRVRRHSARPARARAAGDRPMRVHRAARPGLHDRDARRDRVAAVRGRRRRHGRHPPRLQPGADRPGHRQRRRAAVRRLRGDRRDRAHRDQRPQRRHRPARRASCTR